MTIRTTMRPVFIVLLIILLSSWVPASLATESATATPQPEATSGAAALSFDTVSGIVDPDNFGWPREVEGLNGVVSIPAKPLRIITASVGHDEITLALVPRSRLVGVGGASKDEIFSNVAALVQETAEISRDPETIIARNPDVVVTSPWFPDEGIDALTRAGIPVLQTDLQQSPAARINNVLLMGYIFGEEARALEFAAELHMRHEALVIVTGALEPRPHVLALTRYADSLWVAGDGATEGSIIEAAGGINAAAAAGIEGNQTTSLEGVIAMAPEVIIIPQPLEYGAAEFLQDLLDNEALAEVPAIRNAQVHVVESRYFTTLSHWNLRGAEELARILWPDTFPEAATAAFSTVE